MRNGGWRRSQGLVVQQGPSLVRSVADLDYSSTSCVGKREGTGWEEEQVVRVHPPRDGEKRNETEARDSECGETARA